MAAGGYAELEPMLALPGTPRALLTTLRKIWDADLDLQALAPEAPRLADLALIERRVHEALPPGALTPRALRDGAIKRLQFARAALGPVELEGHVEVPSRVLSTDQRAPNPTGSTLVQVIMPGGRGLNIRNGNEEFEIESIFFNPVLSELCYRGHSLRPPFSQSQPSCQCRAKASTAITT